jgi:hypothetical protein
MELRSCCQFSTILIFGALAMACGSSEDPNPQATGGATGTTGGTTTGGASSSGGNVTECNINTGYPGDELCILPPDPSKGFQLHYGPSSYDDAAVQPFLIEPGGETTDCYFVKTPNTQMVYTFEYHGRMRPGSHHLIVYAQDNGNVPDGLASNCNQGADARFFVGSQTPTVDIPLPGMAQAPENKGLAMELQANTQMALQLHYINTTQEPMLREAWVNMMYSDPATVTQIAEPIFFLAGIAMNVAPNTEKIINGSGTAPQDLRVLGITGHFHAHTVRFSAWHVVAGQKTLILEDYDWHEPTNLPFDSVNMNPQADPVQKIPGGFSGILNIKKGERIEWQCHIINDSMTTLTFDNAVYTGEMCNLFGFYTPSIGGPWRAINL